MTSTLSDEARAALSAGRLGHMVTINPDGSPQVSIVWIGLEGDEIVVGHLARGRKLTNIERDPRVVVSVEADGQTEIGLRHHLIVQGTARITEGGGPELLQRLAHTYLGPGVKFPPFDNPPAGSVIHIRVDKLGGVGPWSQPES
jgi:PPOX class probable F420-dependent enzyme